MLKKLDTPPRRQVETQLHKEIILMFLKNRGILLLPARKNRSHAINPTIISKFEIRNSKEIQIFNAQGGFYV